MNNQFSPFQQDGDYSPRSSSYFCKACHGWVQNEGWENGTHGSERNHITNTKKMG